MSAITQQEADAPSREAISLPILRPVQKPASIFPPAVPPANDKTVQPPDSPPAVQSVQKLNLDLLEEGDKIVIRTANTTYNFEMSAPLQCKVVTGKSSSRSGEVTLMGGTNAEVTEYSPNRILVGGRATYQFPDEESAVLTSVVESIFWVAARKSAQT